MVEGLAFFITVLIKGIAFFVACAILGFAIRYMIGWEK